MGRSARASFYEELARGHRVVRYDRIGAGLSDASSPAPPTMESESAALQRCIEASGDGPAAMFACSCAGLATAPTQARCRSGSAESCSSAATYRVHDIPEATRRSLVDFVRTNWLLAAQMFAGLKLPHGSGDEIAAWSRYQRRSAEAEVAAAFLELDLATDARDVVPKVTVPALVLHRRGDRTVPIRHGRELAALLPNARFVTLRGDSHLPWMDDQRDLQRALAAFLNDAVPVDSNGDSPLSAARRRCCDSSPSGSRTGRSRPRSF